jgi:hypothetical protein
VRPKLLLRTHYQANEPRLIIATVTQCSSPVKSHDENEVATLLKKWARLNGYVMSIPGAVYAVGNARDLGLLNDINRWTSSGLALSFLGELMPAASGPKGAILTSLEERFYVRTYLTKAGGLPVKFAKWLLKNGPVTHDRLRKDSILEQLVIDALEDYLALATDTRDRAAIRHERDRLKRSKYTAITKRHKRYPLLTTMARLRLLHESSERDDAGIIAADVSGRLATLSRVIPDILTMEQLIRSGQLQQALDVEMKESARNDLPTSTPASILANAYRFAISRALQACPLAFLDDVLKSAFPGSIAAPSPVAEELLESGHRERPGEVRFHVDRRGKRAFVLLSDGILSRLDTSIS